MQLACECSLNAVLVFPEKTFGSSFSIVLPKALPEVCSVLLTKHWNWIGLFFLF
jgi:hypothetical protein